MSSDVRDILAIDDNSSKKQNLLDKDALLSSTDKKPVKKSENSKRPRNIPRELWGLKDTFGGDFPSILPPPEVQMYKQPKAQITGKVRQWQWINFKNSARSDNLELFHWKRADMLDKEQEYYFAQFNKKPVLPRYSDDEYETHLSVEGWSRAETDYLMDLCERYDLRFIVVHDRWDKERFGGYRTVEDIKERYYMILDVLNNVMIRAEVSDDAAYGPGSQWGIDTTCLVYHADHERRRKVQLERIYARTAEQIAEEEQLAKALHRIELLKKERQKKTMDLQKLLSQADYAIRNTDDGVSSVSSFVGGPGVGGVDLARSLSSVVGQTRKRNVGSGQSLAALASQGLANAANVSWDGLKFPDLSKNQGVHLRSTEIKLPPQIGIKKSRFIDGFLTHFDIDPTPIPTEDIIEPFNSLRADILLIQELYATLSHLEYELCSYREKYNKRLSDSGTTSESNKNVPSSLLNSHTSFTNSSSLQLSGALQSAIRAADVKQRNTIVPLNVVTASGLSPPGTRSTSSTVVTDSNQDAAIRKRRRTSSSEDRLFTPTGNDVSRKSLKKIRVNLPYMMKKRL